MRYNKLTKNTKNNTIKETGTHETTKQGDLPACHGTRSCNCSGSCDNLLHVWVSGSKREAEIVIP